MPEPRPRASPSGRRRATAAAIADTWPVMMPTHNSPSAAICQAAVVPSSTAATKREPTDAPCRTLGFHSCRRSKTQPMTSVGMAVGKARPTTPATSSAVIGRRSLFAGSLTAPTAGPPPCLEDGQGAQLEPLRPDACTAARRDRGPLRSGLVPHAAQPRGWLLHPAPAPCRVGSAQPQWP